MRRQVNTRIPDGSVGGETQKPPAGAVVSPKGPAEAIQESGPTAVLLTLLIIVGGTIVILTGLVLSGRLGKEWLDAITSDSEVGLVLTTIYIIAIELDRDRRDRAKDRKEDERRKTETAQAEARRTQDEMKGT